MQSKLRIYTSVLVSHRVEPVEKPFLATSPDSYSQRVDISQAISPDEDFAHVPYKIKLSDGRLFEGITDKDGRTARIHDSSSAEATIIFGDGEWSLDLDADHEDDGTDAH